MSPDTVVRGVLAVARDDQVSVFGVSRKARLAAEVYGTSCFSQSWRACADLPTSRSPPWRRVGSAIANVVIAAARPDDDTRRELRGPVCLVLGVSVRHLGLADSVQCQSVIVVLLLAGGSTGDPRSAGAINR